MSAMRPYLKRALVPTFLAIEAEAVAPYVAALEEADRVLDSLAAGDATSAASSPASRRNRRPVAHRKPGSPH
jgi:hypothetical protein